MARNQSSRSTADANMTHIDFRRQTCSDTNCHSSASTAMTCSILGLFVSMPCESGRTVPNIAMKDAALAVVCIIHEEEVE